ncbi:MAG TPA: glycosyltransferase [Cyclobacteriaceae bacterium]|nr:glycosyltransferase [Cyclobacteriaceae bacterium]
MPSLPKYSVIIPVYNRPAELDELLRSLTEQTFSDFEVIVVDDGSQQTSQTICESYSSRLSTQYFFKPNSGPGPSRNYGFEKATGQYFVLFDSDCILPPTYFAAVEKFLASNPIDAWGGPDRGHEKFTPLQQAMAYTMSSFWTTGGIRGGKNQADKFQPRSFNMGFSRRVWEVTKGFAFDRLAEDIELSIRMRKEGFKVALIPDAFVYHKRRTNLWEFFKQVQGFGRGRVRVGRIHKGEVKLTHWFPTMFLIYFISVTLAIALQIEWWPLLFFPMFLYLGAIWASCYFQTFWSLRKTWPEKLPPEQMGLMIRIYFVSLLTVPATIVQLCGYGLGFLKEKLSF